MEKNQFIQVLKAYASSTSDDAKQVLQLKEDFPYSQLLHALAARLAKDHGFSNQQSELQSAAVYAADRSALKDVMTFDAPVPSVTVPVAKVKTTKVQVTTKIADPESEDVAEEVIHDLEKLHELRHNFEMMFVDVDASPAPTKKTKVSAVDKPAKPAKKSKAPAAKKRAAPKATAKSSKKTKTKKKRAGESSKAATKTSRRKVQAPKKKTKKKTKPRASDDLIDEIAKSKKELAPESKRQKEQLKIIDQFIKTQPSITHLKDKLATAPSGDLSTIKTGEFGDNVVSETLVEILVKQGKKDKAIELLKKLIWKFPQKKAYFAAQIEELKK